MKTQNLLRALKILAAVVSLSAIVGCADSPTEPVRQTAHTVACVRSDMFPRNGAARICDGDANEDEEDGSKRKHKKVPETRLPE